MTTIENYGGNPERTKEKMTYGRDAIVWRRTQVLGLSSQGYTHREIVSKLQIAKGTVSNDLAFIKKQSIDNLQKHIHEVVPMEYQKCMTGMKSNLKETLEIANSVTDPRVKLQARAIANDCYKFILDMSTNARIISDAIKYVTQKTEQVNSLQKLDEQLTEEEATTTSGFTRMSCKKDAMGYDAMSTYLPIDGLGINALPDSEKYKRGIKENRTGRTRTLGIWMSCYSC